jgi:predicted transcriptional regulator
MSYHFITRMKYRSRTDIAAVIVRASLEGAEKTKIMYKAYLSYAQLKEYLEVLTKNDFLEHDEPRQIYAATQKGRNFLKAYDNLEGLVHIIQ